MYTALWALYANICSRKIGSNSGIKAEKKTYKPYKEKRGKLYIENEKGPDLSLKDFTKIMIFYPSKRKEKGQL